MMDQTTESTAPASSVVVVESAPPQSTSATAAAAIEEDEPSTTKNSCCTSSISLSYYSPSACQEDHHNDDRNNDRISHQNYHAIEAEADKQVEDEEEESLEQQIRALSWDDVQGEWIDAARYQDADILHAIYEVYKSLILNVQDSHGNTALHMASANGHVDIVNWLLQQPDILISLKNHAGNTPLHWAAANGHEQVVQLFLIHDHNHHQNTTDNQIDVLQRNAFGRSILTEGFQSDNAAVIQSLLEHESANEERLVSNLSGGDGGGVMCVEDEVVEEKNEDSDEMIDAQSSRPSRPPSSHSVIQDLAFGGNVDIRVREIAMASDNNVSIVGQESSTHDRTGLSVWSSSIVAAHWMMEIPLESFVCNNPTSSTSSSSTIVLELGAGCAVPSLVLAKRFAQLEQAASSPIAKVYASDWNLEVVDNIQYNMQLNHLPSHCCRAMSIDWKDPTTWKEFVSATTTTEPLIENRDDNSAKKPNIIVGADLIYEISMVDTLVNVIRTLLRNDEFSRFYYVAPKSTPRCGGPEFIKSLLQEFRLVHSSVASNSLTRNPLASQDDEECFVHFHELITADFQLYEFAWM